MSPKDGFPAWLRWKPGSPERRVKPEALRPRGRRVERGARILVREPQLHGFRAGRQMGNSVSLSLIQRRRSRVLGPACSPHRCEK